MTLRDIAAWTEVQLIKLRGDVEIAFTEPIWDWPIYIVCLAAVVSLLALPLLGYILGLILLPFFVVSERWNEYISNSYDTEGNAITPLARFLDRTWDGFAIFSALFLVWVIIGFVALMFFNWSTPLDDTEAWIVIGLPTVTCLILLYLIRRGRIANRRARDEQDYQNPD